MTTANQAVLTEDAILKMSEDDYMNDVQLEFFRDRLRQMERDIRNNAGETTEHLRETVIVPDPADLHDRGRACAGAAYSRPRAQAAQEDRAGTGPDRQWRLWLLRGNR